MRQAAGLGGSPCSRRCGLLAALALPTRRSRAAGPCDWLLGRSTTSPATRPDVPSGWTGRWNPGRARAPRCRLAGRRGVSAAPDPTNPGSASYDFSSIDRAVRDAEARGLAVLLTVNAAPDLGGGTGAAGLGSPGTWKPNPSDLADFSQALAARYSGSFDPDGSGPAPPLPAVQAMQLWDEPNQDPLAVAAFRGEDRRRPRPLPGDAQRLLPGVKRSTRRCS